MADLCEKNEFIALSGDVGVGKTTFAKYFIQFLCENDTKVQSPTFNFVFTYQNKMNTIWHFDLYRLHNPNEVWELGIEDAIDQGTILVEWPDIIKHLFLQILNYVS